MFINIVTKIRALMFIFLGRSHRNIAWLFILNIKGPSSLLNLERIDIIKYDEHNLQASYHTLLSLLISISHLE